MDIRLDDLTAPAVIALLQMHLEGMRAHSPPGSVHALDLPALRCADISFWTAWEGQQLCGCAALKALGARQGEIKSMRTADACLRKGVAATLLSHIVEVARQRGYKALYLETGTGPAFAAAHRLYERFGFESCAPFAQYQEDPFSRFMRKDLTAAG